MERVQHIDPSEAKKSLEQVDQLAEKMPNFTDENNKKEVLGLIDSYPPKTMDGVAMRYQMYQLGIPQKK